MLSQLCRQSAASDKLWWGSTTSVSLYRCRSPACKELDSTVQYDIIIFTYCRAAYPGGLHAQQSETAHSAAAGQFASTPANRDRSPATSERTGATYRAALWRDRSSAQHRARLTRSQKNARWRRECWRGWQSCTDCTIRAAAWRCP